MNLIYNESQRAYKLEGEASNLKLEDLMRGHQYNVDNKALSER
jgi:hypothetical protein